MTTVIVGTNARYQQAIGKLHEIRVLQRKVIEQIRMFKAAGGKRQCGCPCRASFKEILGQVLASFAKENLFLRTYRHPDVQTHLNEHWIIERVLRTHCEGAAGSDLRCCAHAFDSFLVHQAKTDQSHYRIVRVQRVLDAELESWRPDRARLA